VSNDNNDAAAAAAAADVYATAAVIDRSEVAVLQTRTDATQEGST